MTASLDDAIPLDRPIRLLFITEDDPLYVIRFFEVFFDEYPAEEMEIAAVTVDHAFHEPLVKTARRMYRFFGPVGFVRTGVRFALAKLRRTSIANLARGHGVELLPATSVNDPAYAQRVRDLDVDLIVSVAAPEIFKADLLRAPRLGCINIHSGRLPVYRGMMPNFWQLLNKEPCAAVTVHEMAEKIDAGRVLAVRECPLRERDSLHRVMTETKRQGARLMIQTICDIRRGDHSLTPIDMTGAGYNSFPTPRDVEAFRAVGHRLI